MENFTTAPDTLGKVLAAGGLQMNEGDIAPYAANEEERDLLQPQDRSLHRSRVKLPLMIRYLDAVKEAGLIAKTNFMNLAAAAARMERHVFRWLLKAYATALTAQEKEDLLDMATREERLGIAAMIGLHVPLSHEQRQLLLETTLGNLAEHMRALAIFGHRAKAKNRPLLEAWGKRFPEWEAEEEKLRGEITLDAQAFPDLELILNDILTYVSVYAQIYGEEELLDFYDISPMPDLLGWEDFWSLVLKYRELVRTGDVKVS